ncbi:MAG: PIG-L family deacetylase [Clostridia bacterium]|nr:PIG-L family deacetylase [Clostridia bacterium]
MKLNKKSEIVHGQKQIYTDMVIAAHQDDIEIMCPQGIIKGYQNSTFGLVAVVATNGSGSPRAGKFAAMTDAEMMKVRRLEQIAAAKTGDYAELVMLNFTSAEIKNQTNPEPTNDIVEMMLFYRPQTMYIHNLADKHPTHVGTALRCIEAIRKIPKALRPSKLYGCEVWRGLDWLNDDEKIVFDVSGNDKLLQDVLAVYESQIAGGKRYDLATLGRRRANATYSESHGVDACTQAAYAMDLTPLIEDDTLSPREFIRAAIERFKNDILF